MIITNKTIHRRAFLRGAGASLALPLLDSMIPALANAQNRLKPVTRLGIVYVPNGVIMDRWTPKSEGSDFEITPILQGLSPYRNQMLILSGLNHNEARQLPGEAAGDHPRACAAYLTGVHCKQTSGADARAGLSFDQIAAKELGKQTELSSLELGIESAEVVGQCIAAYSCAYSNTFSWSAPSTPLPMENRPRAVFERLFGDSNSTDSAERLARVRKNRSILDFVNQEINRLLTGLGPADRTKVNQYLDAIRDVERRIQLAEQQSSKELPALERPGGIPPTFTEHVKLMFDLQTLAYQTDLTRVSTFMVGHEMSSQSYPEIGFADPYHAVTHHQGDPAKIEKCVKVNTFHIQMFAYLLEKMRSTPDGDGSLLDHSLMVYGSPLSDGNLHLTKNLPVLIMGGGSGQLKTGRHLRYPADTPMTNLFLTVLDKVGVSAEKIGDSTARLEL